MTRNTRILRTSVVFITAFTLISLTPVVRAADQSQASASQPITQPVAGNAALRVVINQGHAEATNSVARPSAAGIFQAPVKYSTGGYDPYAVAIADVNGDGHADLVVANQEQFGTESSVGVLLGNGDGTYQAAATFDSGGISAYSIVVADVNADGHPDILVANGCSSGTYCSAEGVLAVLLGNGDGTFQAAHTYSTGGSDIYHSIVAVGDLNADHKLDVVIAHGCGGLSCTDGSISVLLGNNSGAFGKAKVYPSGGAGASSVAIADMNADGKPDLLTVNWCATVCSTSTPVEGSVGVLLGNGDGTFQSAVSYPSGGDGSRAVAAADVNGDGKVDVLTASCGPAACAPGFPGGTAGVLLGNGDGTLQAAVANNAGDSPDAILTTDLNGDGKLDIVVGNWGTADGSSNKGAISILRGNGNGMFPSGGTILAGGNEVPSVAAGDLNGDGKADVVAADVAGTYRYNTPGSVSVFLNNRP